MTLIYISCSSEDYYPNLSENSIVLQEDRGKWDENTVHTMSVVEVNRGGYKYWAYYGLDHYEDSANVKKAGLARSNDLINWEKYTGNPVIESNCRWPTVVFVDDVFHIFYAEYKSNTDSRIVSVSSEDGINFSKKQVIVPYKSGIQNQNPFIYLNESDQTYYLFYYHGRERGTEDNKWDIFVKKTIDITKMQQAPPEEILSSPYTIAAPSIAYYNDQYYLLIEAFKAGMWNDKWVTLAFESSSITGKYTQTANNPILSDDDACAFQYVLNGQLYIFYSHRTDSEKNQWDLRMVKGTK
jgi:hypothetical protein